MSLSLRSARLSSSAPGAITPDLSLFRLYTLRLCYFILAAGLGVFVWPMVFHHSSRFASTYGIQYALLAGLGLTAVLGLKYPVQMLPLLLFELIWKAVYLVGFALPAWSHHQIDASMADDIGSVLVVVILIPLIPWRYVFAHYLRKPGERWS